MITATYNGKVVAEAEQEDLVRIEGGWYFPPEAVKMEYFTKTDHETTCHWKGQAHYYTIEVDGQKGENLAWYYPDPQEGSEDRVGKKFANYVSFYPQVTIG